MLHPVSFDARTVFGKVRAPVKVTLNGYTYRSTLPRWEAPSAFRSAEQSEAAGLEGGETTQVKLGSTPKT